MIRLLRLVSHGCYAVIGPLEHVARECTVLANHLALRRETNAATTSEPHRPPPVSNAPLGPPWPERRTEGVERDGVYFPPNACTVCGRWFPPYKAGVPSEVADRYCWEGEHSG